MDTPAAPPLPHHSSPNIETYLRNAESAITSSRHPASNNLASDSSKPQVYANSYVDLGLVEVVGFDYDYTIVQYNNALLELIYEMARDLLVTELRFPPEICDLKFDPTFPIRGLAVDRKTGWICQLSYTHKVSLAYEGKKKVPTERFRREFKSKRSLTPNERQKRLKPLNDLFSMAECALVADVVEFFNNNDIAFDPTSVVDDVLKAIGKTHMSGDFHRKVAENPAKYFESTPRMKEVLKNLKSADKTLLLISNSPFWYVNAGMKYILGSNWRSLFDCVIASAGKPGFYIERTRPFREIVLSGESLDDFRKENISFEKVEKLSPDKVYSGGCLRELVRLMPALQRQRPVSKALLVASGVDIDIKEEVSGGGLLNTNVLYLGDSLFADLVDAKREFGWLTAAVLRELSDEATALRTDEYVATRQTIDILLSTLRLVQEEMGMARTEEDMDVLDTLETKVSESRDRLNSILGNKRFGSIFRARHQPSLLSQSLKRYSDLYMSSVEDLVNYSPQHRFYPSSINSINPHENKPASRSSSDRVVLGLGYGDRGVEDN
ncbi:hypothetical protein TrVE_jg2414 [Triparma verrucosa]|uniref:Uncharacterized protein n=1 Tax=Triparma verrucosa TaxID=1606542 RepID=A0A9W7CKA1_9STRA|nr:hypothetical protein TrVE_jg2414 [Triparma verrucosa]